MWESEGRAGGRTAIFESAEKKKKKPDEGTGRGPLPPRRQLRDGAVNRTQRPQARRPRVVLEALLADAHFDIFAARREDHETRGARRRHCLFFSSGHGSPQGGGVGVRLRWPCPPAVVSLLFFFFFCFHSTHQMLISYVSTRPLILRAVDRLFFRFHLNPPSHPHGLLLFLAEERGRRKTKFGSPRQERRQFDTWQRVSAIYLRFGVVCCRCWCSLSALLRFLSMSFRGYCERDFFFLLRLCCEAQRCCRRLHLGRCCFLPAPSRLERV